MSPTRLLLWMLSVVSLPLLAAPPAAPSTARAPVETPFLAVLTTADDTPFEEVLGGAAQARFQPVITPGVAVQLVPGQSIWVRLRAQLPQRADGEWVLRAQRTPIESMRLYLPEQPGAAVAQTGFFAAPSVEVYDRASLRLRLPGGDAGPAEWYLRLQGDVRTALLPQLMTTAAADAADARATRWIHYSLIGLSVVALLALLRFALQPQSGAGSVAFASLLLIPAGLGGTGLLYTLPFGGGFAERGTMGLWMLLLLPCGPLLLATARFSGAPFGLPALMPKIRATGLALPWLALAMLLLRTELAPTMQLLVWLVWASLAIACLAMLLADPRRYRWGPIIGWTVLVFALWLRASVELQWLDANELTMFGPLAALVLLTASMLVLPWLRAWLQSKPSGARPATAATAAAPDRLAAARGTLQASLQALARSDTADAEWIAFRKLLSGLKPLLPQQSSAIVAMNYRGIDLLLVEPADAEERYRALLERSSSMLRGMSRARGGQQIAIDFDGPGGKLPMVQLAAVPLPIDRPGWGLLLIERPSGIRYGDDELALCSELAALATRGSERSASAAGAVPAADLDVETGTYRGQLIEQQLQEQIAQSQVRARPLAILRIEIDGMAKWHETRRDAALDALRKIGTALRDQLEFGESIGRLEATTFLMILPGKDASVCLALANRVITAMGQLGLPPDVRPHVGIGELRRGEATARSLIERAGRAAETARRSGTPTVG